MVYKNTVAGFAVSLTMLAGAAQAATLKVEVWDVLAPEPGGFTQNNEGQQINARNATPANTIALRPVDGDGDTVSGSVASFQGSGVDFFTGGFLEGGGLDGDGNSLGGSFAGNSWAGVDYIVSNLDPDLTFNINSSQLQNGFTAVGLISTSSAPSIDTFFGTDFGGVGGNSILGTIARITGTLSVNENDVYSITSDDGYRLKIGGEQLAFLSGLDGGSTNPSDPFSGVSGPAMFEMLWFEGNTVGAKLQVEGNFTPVPLPASALLLLGGLGGLGGLSALRRRKRTA